MHRKHLEFTNYSCGFSSTLTTEISPPFFVAILEFELRALELPRQVLYPAPQPHAQLLLLRVLIKQHSSKL
jgi:hypothetical protein